ncbi:MAG: hypothetical protein QW524_02615 [Candidatus Woesearchaeota archaeon]
MISKELIDYIKSTLSQGFSEEQIKNVLRNSGYSEEDINKAFLEVKNNTITISKKSHRKLFLFFLALLLIFLFSSFFFLNSLWKNFMVLNTQTSHSLVEDSNRTSENRPNFQISNNSFSNNTILNDSVFVLNCGNIDCFIQAIENDQNATVTYDFNVDFFGFLFYNSLYLEAKKENDLWKYYFRYLNASLSPSITLGLLLIGLNESEKQLFNSQIEKSKEMIKNLIGKEGMCIFKKENLLDLIRSIKTGSIIDIQKVEIGINLSSSSYQRVTEDSGSSKGLGIYENAESCEGSFFENPYS